MTAIPGFSLSCFAAFVAFASYFLNGTSQLQMPIIVSSVGKTGYILSTSSQHKISKENNNAYESEKEISNSMTSKLRYHTQG